MVVVMYFLVYIPVQIPIEAIQLPAGADAVLLDALPLELKAELRQQIDAMMHSLNTAESQPPKQDGAGKATPERDHLERCFQLPEK